MKKHYIYWRVTAMNTCTGKTIQSKLKKTYDEISDYVRKSRNRSKYRSICAEEMDKRGKHVLDSGRVVSLDSKEDERLISISSHKTLRLKDVLEQNADDYDYEVIMQEN